MKRAEYLDGSNSRLTRAVLALRVGDGLLGDRTVELYLPTESVLSYNYAPEFTYFVVCSLSCCSRNFTRAMSWSTPHVDKSGDSSQSGSSMVVDDLSSRRVAVYWRERDKA